MKIAFFDTHRFDQEAFEKENVRFGYQVSYFEHRLTELTAGTACGFDVVCSFVNDILDAKTIKVLRNQGIKLIALRSAGYNHVDLKAAAEMGISVVRVPEYSPFAVAEHAIALILTLNRKTHRAYTRVRELNFSLEGLVGFDLHGKTVGVIGTGKIGRVLVKILAGFGCRVLAFDSRPDSELAQNESVKYVGLDEIYSQSDVISLHVPLTKETRHMIDARAISLMKPNVILVNTGRGALIETKAMIAALKEHKIAGAALDVYEEEEGVFFHDFSNEGISDDVLARLLTFPNVLITSHQAFLTREALSNIASTTLENIRHYEQGQKLENEVKYAGSR